jgi:hypothetical protein
LYPNIERLSGLLEVERTEFCPEKKIDLLIFRNQARFVKELLEPVLREHVIFSNAPLMHLIVEVREIGVV